jgi:tellurite resistance protein TehA-like permease
MCLHPFPPPPPGVPTELGPDQVAHAERLGRIAKLLIVPGLLIAMVAGAAWQISIGVASMGGDEADLTRGWKGFWLSVPNYALGAGIAIAAFVLALRALRAGATNWRSALALSTLGLLFALGSSTRDSAEIVMSTRAATVSWLLFGIDLVVVAIALFLGLRWAQRRH